MIEAETCSWGRFLKIACAPKHAEKTVRHDGKGDSCYIPARYISLEAYMSLRDTELAMEGNSQEEFRLEDGEASQVTAGG